MSELAELLASAIANHDRQQAHTGFQYMRPGVTPQNVVTPPGVQEPGFRQWVQQNKVPFDVNAKGPTDYDMRGFYAALQRGDPRAQSSVNASDGQLHYPDIWKTPAHPTFSRDSQWAGRNAPTWNERDQLIAPGGAVLYDEWSR